jgi:hypothetical protein
MDEIHSGSKSDDALIGGRSYNEKHRGYEFCNFKSVNGKLYGYFQTIGRDPDGNYTVNLERITPGTSTDQLDGVTVIWIATDPTLSGSNR